MVMIASECYANLRCLCFFFFYFFAAQGYGIQSPLLIYLLSLKTQKSANRIACFSSFTSLKHEGNEGTLASSSDRERAEITM
jgi:hypothetical protein